ncbi:hypothetical protein [Streptosporangium sp. NPDC049376]|uniref:hypothetical protein n=1 Tax=Streptosporangium sp. NPDC049376 TaxID=3366192 RepID=UPI003796A5AD
MRNFTTSPIGKRTSVVSLGVIVGLTVAGCGVERAQQYTSVSSVTTSSSSPSATLPGPASSEGSPLPSPPEKTPEPTIGSVLQVTNGKRIPMPLDPYLPSMEELRNLSLARDAAANSCMRAIGFTDWEDGIVRSWDETSFNEYDYFDYLDPATAADKGYPRPEVAPEIARLSKVRPKHGPSKEQMAAYDGRDPRTKSGHTVPAGGCAGEAKSKIYGDTAELPVDSRALAVDSRISAMGDSRVRQAVSAWKTCMSRNGLRYESPVVPRHDVRWASRNASTPADAEEKRVAGIDATCQKEVNLTGVYKTVRIAYEELIVAKNKEKLAAAQQTTQKWTANASAVLAKNGE